MAKAKDKASSKAGNENNNVLRVAAKDEAEARNRIAQAMVRPTANAAFVVSAYNANSSLDVNALVQELVAHCNAVNDEDMKRAEAMLIAQAHALQGIFTNLASRAAKAEYMSTFQPYLSLALKAQSQCRATLETLAAIKNPQPVAFVRQANIAAGPQQVNNHTGTRERAPAREKFSNSTNELLENHHERLDTGTPEAAGATDSTLETVGAVERAENGEW